MYTSQTRLGCQTEQVVGLRRAPGCVKDIDTNSTSPNVSGPSQQENKTHKSLTCQITVRHRRESQTLRSSFTMLSFYNTQSKTLNPWCCTVLYCACSLHDTAPPAKPRGDPYEAYRSHATTCRVSASAVNVIYSEYSSESQLFSYYGAPVWYALGHRPNLVGCGLWEPNLSRYDLVSMLYLQRWPWN